MSSVPATFQVSLVRPGSEIAEAGVFELQPKLDQAARVCDLWRQFFRGRQSEFQDRIGFLNQGDFAIDWSAAPGGVAFAIIKAQGRPASFALLVSGQDPEAAAGMAAGFRHAILPGLNIAELAMPGVVIVLAPNFAEWAPTLHLLNATLAAVFFDSLNSRRH